jgi:hypothetical protein
MESRSISLVLFAVTIASFANIKCFASRPALR